MWAWTCGLQQEEVRVFEELCSRAFTERGELLVQM